MDETKKERVLLVDGSRLIIESAVRAGAEVFVGYPITPANLLYLYSSRRFPMMFPAPDEISTLQWMSGFSAAGRYPVTATSFPGFALMLESLNMAYMMELPMLIVLAQRLGPSTGSATTGAEGDVMLLRGAISGGYPFPVFSVSSPVDCWNLTAKAVSASLKMRTPVVLLTSKELAMTMSTVNAGDLEEIERPVWERSSGEPYLPYQRTEGLVPPFAPLGDGRFQVRFNASTHDESGLIRKTDAAALSNTKRLMEKVEKWIADYTFYELDEEAGAAKLIVSYGITSGSAREALGILRGRGEKVSLLIVKTLLPVPPKVIEIMSRYDRVFVAEENLTGLLCEIIYGVSGRPNVQSIGKIGTMITPREIADRVVAS
jgi:2-oxoglutarate/2-oxoacid ferredoxin oxidoreductase subunit alpha